MPHSIAVHLEITLHAQDGDSDEGRPTNFARRPAAACGLSPIRFAQPTGIEATVRPLEVMRLALDGVARRVCYFEPSTLRRIIRVDLGRPLPSQEIAERRKAKHPAPAG
jgi:hypothetical protein